MTEPLQTSSLGILSLAASPIGNVGEHEKIPLCFALKYSPPSGMSEPGQPLRKEDYWNMLSGLTDMMVALRQDWTRLQQPGDYASTLLSSDSWLAQVRARTQARGVDTVLDGSSHGPVRWEFCEDTVSFNSAPGDRVSRWVGIDTERPWFAVGIFRAEALGDPHFDPMLSSTLFARAERQSAYERDLEYLLTDRQASLLMVDTYGPQVQFAIAGKSLNWIKTTREGQATLAYCNAATGRTPAERQQEFERRVLQLGAISVEFTRRHIPSDNLMHQFGYGVYTAWSLEGSQHSNLFQCFRWMSLVAE